MRRIRVLSVRVLDPELIPKQDLRVAASLTHLMGSVYGSTDSLSLRCIRAAMRHSIQRDFPLTLIPNNKVLSHFLLR